MDSWASHLHTPPKVIALTTLVASCLIGQQSKDSKELLTQAGSIASHD